MGLILSDTQVAAFERDGILFPLPVLSTAEAAEALHRFEALEARSPDGFARSPLNIKPHLLLPWLDALVRHPRILDAVEAVLGPDILCWSSHFFAKDPNDSQFVTWHQDSTYFDLSSADALTAWVALTPSTPENGCLQVVPGTHGEQIAHHRGATENNMLAGGQEVAVSVDPDTVVDVILQPGEMSLHHLMIFHGSGANVGATRRVGFAIRYIPTRLRQRGARGSATLVRGTDLHGHFDLETPPAADFDAAAIATHAEAVRRVDLLRAKAATPDAADAA